VVAVTTTPPEFPEDARRYPEASQASVILVLGILGVAVLQVLGPFAWVMGNRELEAIDAGRRPPDSRRVANAGRVLGIIGTVLLALGLIAGIVLLLVDTETLGG